MTVEGYLDKISEWARHLHMVIREITSTDVAACHAVRRRIAGKKYYERHKEKLRTKARKRAERAKLLRIHSETPAQAAARKLCHREASAKYRESKRFRRLAWKHPDESVVRFLAVGLCYPLAYDFSSGILFG
ncbi:hypothetical protein GALMADRAFT_216633 [Galerina marginata CBS 339.88]|uniref:Uncharacterized protein n=1 Tax=Galerina marginata (strain CBS 339.88) TaxID=685588 RepID=A0A067SHE8_GALM3|nr:hypothetical protein GALMADRAFT_216633 [Galerina marginata CBS 339.88]